jgi:ribose/xylose/arabinose/galactoside ABC-type transport system permease subunit
VSPRTNAPMTNREAVLMAAYLVCMLATMVNGFITGRVAPMWIATLGVLLLTWLANALHRRHFRHVRIVK